MIKKQLPQEDLMGTNPLLNMRMRSSIHMAGLTNIELAILQYWTHGFTHNDIRFILDLHISQPALSKRLKMIIKKVKRAYDKLTTLYSI